MSRALPKLRLAADGRMHCSWTATLAGPLRLTLIGLPERLLQSAKRTYRSSLGAAGLEDPGALEAEVMVVPVDERTYAFDMIAPLQPDGWNIAATFGVMQAFDALTGPVQEIDGRPRADCAPWFFAVDGNG